MKGLTTLAFAGLLACTGCAVRSGSVPTGTAPTRTAPAPAPRSAPRAPSSPKAVPDRPATVSGSDSVAAALPPAAAAPAAVAAETVRPPAGKSQPADAPPATASIYVFSPQQAASAPKAAAPGATAPSATTSAAAAPSATAPAAETPAPEPPSPSKPAAGADPTPATPGELQLVLTTSTPQIDAGGIVTVDVMASSETAVLDAPLHVSFDPNVMAYVDGTPGDFLAQGGSSVVFFADGHTRPGDVAVAAGRVERAQGATGAGLLCRLRLRGVAAGSTPVIVAQAKAWGVHGEPLNVQAGGTAATVR